MDQTANTLLLALKYQRLNAIEIINKEPRNHCDLNTVLTLNASVGAPRVLLTHIGHDFDVWMMENPLPPGFEAARDGQVIELP